MGLSDLSYNWQKTKMSVNGKEIPYDVFKLTFLMPAARPDNEMQALMEAAPGQTIETSNDEIDLLRSIVIYCIDMLSEQDRYIIESINYEQITYEQLGKRLGMSNVHAWRLKQDAYKRLMNLMLEHKVIKDYLGEDDDE
jgi:DNA-directed RNA polymerase specialized sigma24 family protein